VGRPLRPNGDLMLQYLDEIRACSVEIDNIQTELALLRPTSPAVLSEYALRVYRLNRRIMCASEKAYNIQHENSERRRAALEREARKRTE
jgi:hypothetical protein